MILSRYGILDLCDFAGVAIQRDTPAMCEEPQSLADVQRAHIQRVLQNTHWRIEGASGAAKILGLCPSTLRTRMRKLGINRPTAAALPGGGSQPVAPQPRSWSRPSTTGLGAATS